MGCAGLNLMREHDALMQAFRWTGVIWRQGLFTVADVTSKLIYGLILSRFLLRLGASEVYRPSAEALGLEPTPAVDEVRAIR